MNSRNLQGTLNKPRTLSGSIAKNTGTGKDGITPHIGENGNWFIGEEDTGVRAIGMSAYEVACIAGFEGTEEEWLESLTGKSGVYVGEGEMPEGYNIQVILSENSKEAATKEYVDKAIANINIPTSGDDEWELIVDYTVPEGVQIDSLEFTKDLNGNDFDLKKCIFYTVITATEEGSNNGRNIHCVTSKTANSKTWDNGVAIGTSLAAGDPTSKRKGHMVYLEVVGNTYLTYGYTAQNDSSLWYAVGQSIFRAMNFNKTTNVMYDGCSDIPEINCFRIRSLGTNIMGMGSTIKIMGVRK